MIKRNRKAKRKKKKTDKETINKMKNEEAIVNSK